MIYIWATCLLTASINRMTKLAIPRIWLRFPRHSRRVFIGCCCRWNVLLLGHKLRWRGGRVDGEPLQGVPVLISLRPSSGAYIRVRVASADQVVVIHRLLLWRHVRRIGSQRQGRLRCGSDRCCAAIKRILCSLHLRRCLCSGLCSSLLRGAPLVCGVEVRGLVCGQCLYGCQPRYGVFRVGIIGVLQVREVTVPACPRACVWCRWSSLRAYSREGGDAALVACLRRILSAVVRVDGTG